MSFSFDFGFEAPTTPYDKASMVMLFESTATRETLSKMPGAAAVADTSRFVELFEMQVGLTPYAAGLAAEIVGGIDSAQSVVKRARQVVADDKIPIIIGETRAVTGLFCEANLVAFWGKLGREECNESKLVKHREALLAGVRAATNAAFKSLTGDVILLTASNLIKTPDTLGTALARMAGPVHFSVDLDVLAPGEALNDRAIEPGGLSWYDLTAAVDAVFKELRVESVEITGTQRLAPRSPAAYLAAELALKLASLLAGRHRK